MRINFSRSGICRPGIVDSFANKTNSKLNAVDAGENSAFLAYNSKDEGNMDLIVSSGNTTDQFTYIVHGTKGSIANEDLSGKIETAGTTSLTLTGYDIGTTIQVEVHNTGTGEVFYSNALVVKAHKASA